MLYLFQKVFIVIFMLAVAICSQTETERQGIVLNNQGVAQFQKGEFEEALKSFTRSAEFFPSNAIVHRNLGYFYWERNDLGRAEASLRNAIRLKQDYAITYNLLGVMLLETKREKEALDLFLKADSLEPNDPTILLNIGNAQIKLKDFRMATDTLEKARSIDPKSAPIRISLGYAYAMRNKIKLAVAEVRYGVQLDPNDGVAQFFLGTLYLANRDKDSAITQQRTVSSLNPELAQRLYQAIFSDKILVVPPTALVSK